MALLSPEDYEILPDLEIPVPAPLAAARMTFYTTAEMERGWEDAFAAAIAAKQAELDARERRTKIMERCTAYGYVHKPHRLFHVATDGTVTCNGVPCPSSRDPRGCVYTLDPTFRNAIARFQTLHPEYSVEFRPSGVCVSMNYNSVGMPATLRSRSGDDELVAEDQDAYDIGTCVII